MNNIGRITALLATVLIASPVSAQPVTLEGLWFNDDGLSWDYDATLTEYPEFVEQSCLARLIFDGTAPLAGGVTGQNLVGQISAPLASRSPDLPAGLSGFYHSLWQARPDLRDAIEMKLAETHKKIPFWPFDLLGPAESSSGLGWHRSTDSVGSWRDAIASWSWLYLVEPLTVGSSFSLQLVLDLANDVFLHGRVFDIFASIDISGETYDNVLVMDYTVDFGEGQIVDETGTLIGTLRSEANGRVSFVMDVGPARLVEDFEMVELDCPQGCPEWEAQLGISLRHGELSLRHPPVSISEQNWGALKAQY